MYHDISKIRRENNENWDNSIGGLLYFVIMWIEWWIIYGMVEYR